jgi:outer membrane protein OmpA-like peptidoglycan-associated protein
MKANPKLKIAIEGHICCATSDDLNLSGMRAKVVYDYLVNNGISGNRLSHQGFGSSRPIIPLPETTEEERIQNRRVEVRILSTQ